MAGTGRSALWIVFEICSGILVIIAVLTAIYSDSQVLRAIAGIVLIALVSTATAVGVQKLGND